MRDDRLAALLELSQVPSSSLDLGEVLDHFRQRVASLTASASCEISLWDRQSDGVVTLMERVEDGYRIIADGGEVFSLADYPETRRVLEQQVEVAIRADDERADPCERQLMETLGKRSLLMLPLVSGGETVGLMEVGDSELRDWTDQEVELIRAIAGILAGAVRNAVLFSRVQELSLRDQVTGLYNRRWFEQELSDAVAAGRRDGRPLALLVIDLDGLKRINDLGGHQAGDEALVAAATALTRSTRTGDAACRLGGDEFAVILPGATAEVAMAVAERAQHLLEQDGRGRYTFSGGVAVDTGTAELTAYELYRIADHAAYRAKSAGGAQTRRAA
jgi:diguanylate cyclase (GGDEF)-like protein